MLGRPLAHSQRNRKLPYTYEAQVDRLRGQGSEPVEWSFFSDTVCGIIRMMIDNGYEPHEVRLFGAYGGKLTALDVDPCVGDDGEWLTPPQLCHELEERYRRTMDDRYLGHVEHGECMFEDRDQAGRGPY
jgi:hypothetical protein